MCHNMCVTICACFLRQLLLLFCRCCGSASSWWFRFATGSDRLSPPVSPPFQLSVSRMLVCFRRRRTKRISGCGFFVFALSASVLLFFCPLPSALCPLQVKNSLHRSGLADAQSSDEIWCWHGRGIGLSAGRAACYQPTSRRRLLHVRNLKACATWNHPEG